MIISHRKRFVLFSPWKTASQTTYARLDAWNESPYSRFFDFNPHLNRVVHQHLTCADFVGLPESRLGYLTGAFVRNPYDRCYSGFLQIQRDIADQSRLSFPTPWVRGLVLQQQRALQAQLQRANFAFDVWLALIRDHHVYEIGRNTSLPLHPAHYWTHLAGQPFVDFVGRVETFEADFGAFLARVGIEGEVVASVNANVSGDPAAPPADPSGYKYTTRMSRRSRERIEALFADDFEIFGYARATG